MKKILYILLLVSSLSTYSQEDKAADQNESDYGLYISAGAHIGFWNIAMSQASVNRGSQASSSIFKNVPYNFQLDKLFKNRLAIGCGYTYDKYPANPLTLGSSRIKAVRQNIRFRIYKYMTDPEKRVSIYMGGSAGISNWKTEDGLYDSTDMLGKWWPTVQFIFGVKVKINEVIFWQTELGAGPPCALQSSFGIKF